MWTSFYIGAIAILAFLMPIYPQSLGHIVAFILLLYLGQKNKLKSAGLILSNKAIVCSIVLWLLYLISIVYSEDKTEAWNIFPTKLVLILFPIILSPLLSMAHNGIHKIKRAFIYGCVLSVIINLVFASYNFGVEQIRIQQHLYVEHYGINYFLSSRLSRLMHPGYWSMYLNWAAALLLFAPSILLNQRIKNAALFALVLGIVLSASKAGIISMVFILAAWVICKLKSPNKTSPYLKYIVIAGVLIPMILMRIAPEYGNRFINTFRVFSNKPIEHNTQESNALRLISWNAAIKIIKSHPALGVGLGDVRNELKIIYKKENQEVAYTKALNAHNQFLQTSVGIGLPGLIALLGMLLFFILSSFQNRYKLGIVLGVLVFINLLFESMLETQAGILFIVFWIIIEMAQLLIGQTRDRKKLL
jgi:O-antigen ligase